MTKAARKRFSNVIISLIVATLVVLFYLRYSLKQGVLVGALSGLSTFFLLAASKPSKVRPYVLSFFIGIAWLALLVLVLGYWGLQTFIAWSEKHSLFYYISGIARAAGGVLWPCTRDVTQLIMRSRF